MQREEKVEITGYGYDGEGIGRLHGKVVFVPYTLQGEKVRVKVNKENSSFIKGELVKVDSESELRQKPPCPYYMKCGGCRYQHTTYENELAIKKALLAGQLAKVGFAGNVEVISANEYFYRNKIRLFVGDKGLALKQSNSNTLCYITHCMIAEKEISDAIDKINTFIISGIHQKDYSEVVIRKEEDNLLVNFIKKSKTEINYQGLFLILGKNFGIFETIKGNTIHQIGLTSLQCDEFGLKCSFSPTSFHQVNDEIGKKLYAELINNLVGKNILNCYSGAGVLSGIIAKQNKRVVGIELGKSEHYDAEVLKGQNSLFYLTNIMGDCKEVVPKLNEKFDTLVVDPPRAGVDEKVIECINTLVLKRLIYISCNSATLVRDLGRLKNFKIIKAILFDMFARTGEYETLVVLDKKRK
ncbi:MAG: 23S rRNA (uracil(1939)-C(5))-methyltransferase RlmD [Clostridiales bacterium]|nr:23S rRNA (uracil(1939)-C(5))-methyltransferase RlmD [Clostridiales bacterium]